MVNLDLCCMHKFPSNALPSEGITLQIIFMVELKALPARGKSFKMVKVLPLKLYVSRLKRGYCLLGATTIFSKGILHVNCCDKGIDPIP